VQAFGTRKQNVDSIDTHNNTKLVLKGEIVGGSEGKIQLVHLDIGVWLDEIRAEALPPLHMSGIVGYGIRGFLRSHTLVWLGRWRSWGIVVPSASRCIIN